MDLPPRYLRSPVTADLKTKMVFLGGPRQVGKTTFALGLLGGADGSHPAYLNWDVLESRRKLLRGELPPRQKLVVLDEIHKFARWRNLVKGFYDANRGRTAFLVTGSARLDYYRRGGDSLQGRYHYYRLHPLSLGELRNFGSATLERLLRFGGFPEPFLRGSEREWRRWQLERTQRVLREDLADLERVREVSLIELLIDGLPARVGSPLSVGNLREDLQVAHETVERWIEILERLYYVFRITPFGAPKIRAVKKERKLYFWDWSMAPEQTRFENLVASQLLKYCHWLEDTEGFRMELRFVRDTDKREVDFVVLKERVPLFAVECKAGEKSASPHCAYFRQRTSIPKFYQVHLGNRDSGDETTGTRVLPFRRFCEELGLP
jgi:predicted AAA+ superfamily ATPase